MRLVWDQIGAREYETGTKNGTLYVKKNDGTYEHGVAWNGLISVSESPSGADEQALYADDIKYLSLRSREEFGATVEAYTYPPEFGECDGSAAIADGVFIGQQARKGFCFAYKTIVGNDVLSDEYGYKLHIIYGATASPSDRSYQSVNDSPEAITFSWELTTVPVPVKGAKPTAILTIDSTKADPDKLKQLEDILFGTDETVLVNQPDDWATNYGNYVTANGNPVVGGNTTVYTLVNAVPEDWATAYTSYYTKEGDVYTLVASATEAPEFEEDTYYRASEVVGAPEFVANTYYTAGTDSTLLLPDEVAAIMKKSA